VTGPIECVWTGDAFEPSTAWHRRAAASRFAQGEVIPLDVWHPRSKASHDQFFALVSEAHGTLPEHLAERFPTPDSLRQYALCKAGYCDVDTFTAASKAEALRLSAFVKRTAGEGIQVVVDGPNVTRLTPHSQSMRAMGGQTFQESKAKCLEVIADLLDVPVAALGMERAA